MNQQEYIKALESLVRSVQRKLTGVRCSDVKGGDWFEVRDTLERFWSKVIPGSEEGDCWLWTDGKDSDGYGRLRVGLKKIRAHRVSFEIFKGSIPDGLFVLHSCDNPGCVNPSHLSTGTNLENLRQMKMRGRSLTGEKHWKSKLTISQVREIRSLAGVVNQAELAGRFCVKQSCISKIQLRKSWSHVE